MPDYFDKVFQTEGGVEQLARLPDLSAADLDKLPFGAIRLDRRGNIVNFNAVEVCLSGLKAADIIGKNFFTEVAPCTNVREFAGRFREGIADKSLHVVFPYSFNFKPPRSVTVTLYYHPATDSAWVLVRT